MVGFITSFGLPIVFIGLAIAAFSAFAVYARNLQKCAPNEVIVKYGKKNSEGKGYRLIIGGSTFVWPLWEGYQRIHLETFPVECSVVETPNKDGVPVSVEATANVKVSSDPARLAAAVERILSKQKNEIHAMLKSTLDGLLRQIIGTLSIEVIIQDREKLAQSVLNGAQAELNKLGFEIDVFVINKVSDNEGYIKALGAKRTAEVKREAQVAQAENDREGAIKVSTAARESETTRAGNEAQIADAKRDLDIKKAQYTALVNAETAKAAQAGPLAEADARKAVVKAEVAVQEERTLAEIKLQEAVGKKTEAELQATVIKRAEAEANALRITADGVRQKQVVEAEGAKQARVIKANAESEALRVEAAAEASKVTVVGTAQADITQKTGQAEAQATQARLEAEAKGKEAQAAALKAELLAQAEGATAMANAERAKLLAQAEGALKLNEAYTALSDDARQLFKLKMTLEALPAVLQAGGEALHKAIEPVAQALTSSMASIDNITVYDSGNGSGNGGSALDRIASLGPDTLFKLVTNLKASGMFPMINAFAIKHLGVDLNATGHILEAEATATTEALPEKSGTGRKTSATQTAS